MLETLFLLFLNSCAVSNPSGDGSQTQNVVNSLFFSLLSV